MNAATTHACTKHSWMGLPGYGPCPDCTRGSSVVFTIDIDADDWAVKRLVELRQQGERARVRIETSGDLGHGRFTVAIVRGNGSIERP